MKQRNIQIIIFVTAIGLILSSCKKQNSYIDITQNKWEVVKIREQSSFSYENANKRYVLEFNNNEFNINLDVNNCFGKYQIISREEIEIESLGCTEICCDSDFAENLSHLFPKMTKYSRIENNLIFEGEGEIILKQYEE